MPGRVATSRPASKNPQTKPQQPLPRSTRANPFPKVTGLICRLPLPAFFILDRGCSPWGPDAVIGTPRRGLNISAGDFSRVVGGDLDAGKAPALCPCTRVSPDKRIPHSVQRRSNRKENSAQSHRQRHHLIRRRRLHIRVRECQPASLSPVISYDHSA